MVHVFTVERNIHRWSQIIAASHMESITMKAAIINKEKKSNSPKFEKLSKIPEKRSSMMVI